jgi:hypothetical protein
MKISEKYASKYLKAEHLQGRTVRVQITHVEEDVEMGEEKEKKDVVHFKGRWRPLVLNVTNAKSLAEILGDDSADWVGGNVVLYPVETQTGPGVRIQAYLATDAEAEAVEAPKAKKAAHTEAEPPFNWGERLDDQVDDELMVR